MDRSRIAISERGWADNLDLALHVLRSYGGPLAVCAVVAIVPLAALNHLLVSWMFPDLWVDEESVGILYWITCLVMIEAPLATAPMTLYLGQALFVEKPQARAVARDFIACLPQLFLLQLLLRTILILPVITWIAPYAMWPYLNEVILLERNPLVGRDGRLSTLKRNSLLHRGNSGDNFVRAIGSALLSLLLITALYLTEDMLARHLLGVEPGAAGWLIEMQIAIWIVVSYFAVVRFLSYLDGRIRNEGWEVELLLRAQRARLARPIA
ncbi:MAG: hypothetical protein WD845_07530 [Pirellulales bacterium]